MRSLPPALALWLRRSGLGFLVPVVALAGGLHVPGLSAAAAERAAAPGPVSGVTAPPAAAATNKASAAPAPPVRPTRLGTNEIAPFRPLHFKAPLSTYAKAQLGRLGTQVSAVSAVLYLPADWEAPGARSLLVVCSPSGSPAIPQAPAYTNAALSAGWAVLAADGPPLPADRDSVLWNWGTVSSALEYLERSIPRARAWPVAVGGFSGGAKRAACVAAAVAESRRRLIGIFMGGCNEDRATTGALLFSAGAAFTSTPVFLSNGLDDPIANPGHGAVVKGMMERSGFSRVRLDSYPAGHRLHSPHLAAALAWFDATAGAAPPVAGKPVR